MTVPGTPAWTEEPTAFSVGYQGTDGSWGSSYDLAAWDGLETAITGISWQEDGTLRLECETTEGTSVLTFDPETEELTDQMCGAAHSPVTERRRGIFPSARFPFG